MFFTYGNFDPKCGSCLYLKVKMSKILSTRSTFHQNPPGEHLAERKSTTFSLSNVKLILQKAFIPDPPTEGMGRTPSSSQVPNVGFSGNVFFFMVTSKLNMAYVCISLECPKPQVLVPPLNQSKQKCLTHLLLSHCKSGRDTGRVLFVHWYLYQLIDLG